MLSSGTPTTSELWTYRLLCLLGTMAVLGLSVLRVSLGGTPADPLWLRFVVASLPLGLCIASFVSPAVRAEMAGIAYVILFVVVGWFVVVAAINGFSTNVALAALAMTTGVGVVATTGRLRTWAVVFVLGYVLLAIIGLATLLDGPLLERSFFAGTGMFCVFTLLLMAVQQRRQRRAIDAAESRYAAVFESTGDAMLILDLDTLDVVDFNQRYLELSCLSAQALRASTLHDLLDLRADDLRVYVQRAVEEGATALGEIGHRRRDATTVPVEARLIRLETLGRRCLGLIARDLTEQQQTRLSLERARDEAREMLHLRTAFLNNMSHELRTPLVAITGFADLLEEDLEDEERTEILESLRRSADRLHETLNAILDIAQIDAGEFHLDPEPIEMNEAVREAARLLLPTAREKGIEVRLQACEPARAFTDRAALHRILLNLISNAIKFTAAGSVTLYVEADSHRVRVRIEDTGMGIEPEVMPRLFTPFRQASDGLGREHEGSGLGLTITKRLVDLMAGRIMVESTPAVGTCVTIAFARTWASPEEAFESGRAAGRALPAPGAEPLAPLYDDPDGAAETVVRPLAARSRALIVEDNADTARLIQRMLEPYLDTEVAPTGEQALRLADVTWYDVLLIDIHLGAGIDGLTLLHRLRKMSAYAFVPAVAVTTYTAPGDRERFIAAGFDAYLPKPFTEKQLVAAMEHAHAHRAQVVA